MKPFFIIDVESIGLHGEGFAVAGGFYRGPVPDWEFRFACPLPECSGDASDRAWVLDNIPPLSVTHAGPLQLRNAFWAEWERAKAAGAQMTAECMWPVEAGFVTQCIRDSSSRTWDGPYPFMEIASFMAAAGMDPMVQHNRLENELPLHNPLADVRQSARLLFRALDILASKT